MSAIEDGYEKGMVCNRDGCEGIIEEKDIDGGCSCHINPPCSYCTTIKEYCPECGWDGEEEQMEKDKITISINQDYWERERSLREERDLFLTLQMQGKLPVEELNYRSRSHTHFSMIKEGVYPEGMTSTELRKLIDGTFGGRFELFNNNVFRFIAYTD